MLPVYQAGSFNVLARLSARCMQRLGGETYIPLVELFHRSGNVCLTQMRLIGIDEFSLLHNRKFF